MKDVDPHRRLRFEKLLREYPRRSAAQFTGANDHNPLILEDCPACFGTGRSCRSTPEGTEERILCQGCDQFGVTGKIVPYFGNNSEVIPVVADSDGWVACPKDQWRFTTADPKAWTGARHKRCGQKLLVKQP